MNQEELREAVLAALLDYETLKKTRRLKAVKKALQGTMVATMIGSTSLMAANQGRTNQVREKASYMASSAKVMPAIKEYPQETSQLKILPGAAHFGLNQHSLDPEDEEQLMRLVNQLPKDAELTVIGCTDSIGGQRYNRILGTKRAKAVADYLSQHGIKIKNIANMISKNKQAGWLARRVDIVVSSLTPLVLDLPPAVNQNSLQQPLALPMAPLPVYEKAIKAPQEPELPRETVTPKISETPAPKTESIPRPDQAFSVRQLHLVVGVTHYPLNSHALASAHKDRLMELVQQLPKDAEITVIGRTDSQGIQAFNKNLGMKRAKAVANFLANQGVKIKAVGTKVSSIKSADWMGRRVDIVVDSAQADLNIHLPPPVVQENSRRIANQAKHKNRAAPSIDGKRATAIEKDVSGLIQRARSVYNDVQTEEKYVDTPEWWDKATTTTESCMENSSDPNSCLPKTSP